MTSVGDDDAGNITDLIARLSPQERDAILRGELRLPGAPARPPGPSLRRPPLAEVHTFRVRAEINHSHPPIWRELEVRSDLTLDRVHTLLQAAFDWWDYHLHSFSLGGDPFARESEKFLCPYDVEMGETLGVPAASVRLDETLQKVGDELFYIYDYGDNWDLTLTLTAVLPAAGSTPGGSPDGVCVAGARAAPPEDCGGMRDADTLAEVLTDPAAFDVEEVNAAIVDPNPAMRAYETLLGIPRAQLERVPQRLVEIVHQLQFHPLDIAGRFNQLLNADLTPPAELAQGLKAITWLLDHTGADGLPLTAAGYLKPADVKAIAPVMPAMDDWIFGIHTEINTHPVLFFREALQSYGLLRKSKGRLYATKAALRAGKTPEGLWAFLAERLIRPRREDFYNDVVLVFLLFVATGDEDRFPWQETEAALQGLGWRTSEGGRFSSAVRDATYDVTAVLENVGAKREGKRPFREMASLASGLARAALFAQA